MAGHTGDRDVVAVGLSHQRPEVRQVALGAALRCGLLDADLLRAGLDDDATEVRYRAIELTPRWLLTATDPAPPPAVASTLARRLIELLADDDLAEVAAFALGELAELPLPPPVFDEAVRAIGGQATDHDDPLCRESAVAALGALGAGLEVILAATTDRATVRRRAILALAPFDGPEVEAALRRALDDRDWQVRQAAEDLLED